MAEHPPEPEELALRYVTVWAKDEESWKLEVDYPDFMSPYEVSSMLEHAAEKLKLEVRTLNQEDEGDDEEEVGEVE